jgi:hypothetical protein
MEVTSEGEIKTDETPLLRIFQFTPADDHCRGGALLLSRLVPNLSSQSSFPIAFSLTFSAFDSSNPFSLPFFRRTIFARAAALCGAAWQEQVQPGILQSGCRRFAGERSAQNEESTRGQTPRGYPGQALPVGPGEWSVLCLMIDI